MGQNSEDFLDLGTGLAVIPADYREGSSGVVPIYVRTADEAGNRINQAWIGALARAAHKVRFYARFWLFDEWRSSELGDETVQDMWGLHKDALGLRPHNQISVHAKWKAREKRSGDRRVKDGLDVELLDHILDTLEQSPGFDEQIEIHDYWDRLEEQLIEMGMADIREILQVARYDGELRFESKNNESRNTVSKRFYRAIRKAASLL